MHSKRRRMTRKVGSMRSLESLPKSSAVAHKEVGSIHGRIQTIMSTHTVSSVEPGNPALKLAGGPCQCRLLFPSQPKPAKRFVVIQLEELLQRGGNTGQQASTSDSKASVPQSCCCCQTPIKSIEPRHALAACFAEEHASRGGFALAQDLWHTHA
eukprot:TRINITY_DN67245_c0_g1_i1.p1 TRINITY_DN67245_c0_g1~~TRINITY_DN67245_c0_g1_i1.p1  ORF type:complete len:155 (-),score=21.39 TRINITY_DN67245_c0_g1_i1:47-511(-)